MKPRSSTPEVALAVEAGTVVIAHYNIWHRATANISDRTRYMLKFLFARRREPTFPAWDAHAAVWTPPSGDHRTLWQHMWRWHRGEAKPNRTPEDSSAITALVAALDDPDPQARHLAADDLGTIRAPTAIPTLAAHLRDENEAMRLNAVYALGAQGALRCEVAERWQDNLARDDFTDPGQLDAPYGLAAAGAAAVPALQQVLTDDDGPVRAAAATALGYIGPAGEAARGLIAALEDRRRVRSAPRRTQRQRICPRVGRQRSENSIRKPFSSLARVSAVY